MARSKRPTDQIQLAKLLVDQLTGETTPESPQDKPAMNPAAVALGFLGGLKGGEGQGREAFPLQAQANSP